MRVVLRPRAQVEEAWRQHDLSKVRARQASAAPSVVMADEAAALRDHREFIFRGRPYRVPPVPWADGARLLKYQDHLQRISTDASPHAVIGPLRVALSICKRLCRPRGIIRRALWRVSPNPFLQATPREVGEILGFFSACLVMDRAPSGTMTTSRGISSRTSPDSWRGSRRGRAQTVSRSPGAIS